MVNLMDDFGDVLRSRIEKRGRMGQGDVALREGDARMLEEQLDEGVQARREEQDDRK
jgi:hypothetical protein